MERTWSKGLLGLVGISGLIAVIAFLAGLMELVALVVFPILFVGIMYVIDEPGEIVVSLDAPAKVKVGDEVEIHAILEVTKGAGMFLVELPTFDYFKIVDGSNVRSIFKGFGKRREEVTYKVLALRRGQFSVRQVKYTYFPTMGMLNTSEGELEVDFRIEVVPRVEILKKKGLRIDTSMLNPRTARSRIGPPSSDFDSIRSYMPGDPYKSINWKASSRNPGNTLLINKYEREGLHTFLFLMDRGNNMRTGTKEENPLEYGISLALSFSNLLLNYHFNVGSWIIQRTEHRERNMVQPGSGMEHYIRIRRQLTRLESRTAFGNVYRADSGLIRILKETSPIVFLITSISDSNIVGLNNLCRSIGSLASRLILVDVIPYGIYAKFSEFNIVSMMTESFVEKAKKRYYNQIGGYASIIPWDPVNTSQGRIVGKMIRNLRR